MKRIFEAIQGEHKIIHFEFALVQILKMFHGGLKGLTEFENYFSISISISLIYDFLLQE